MVSLNESATTADLQSHCKGRVAGFKTPVRFYSVEDFPLTASGKIRKTELQELVAAERLTLLG